MSQQVALVGRICLVTVSLGNSSAVTPFYNGRLCKKGAQRSLRALFICTFRSRMLGASATRIVPTAGVPVGSGCNLRVLARYSRGFQRTRRRVLWRPSLVTFFDVKKVTRCRSTTGISSGCSAANQSLASIAAMIALSVRMRA